MSKMKDAIEFSVEEMLEEELKLIRENKTYAKKAVIIYVDDRDPDKYMLGYAAAGFDTVREVLQALSGTRFAVLGDAGLNMTDAANPDDTVH